ncbi:unnamed protein product [Caenorhabditis angaria]|uniref:Sodium/potassium-transporting ATPase subunit beta n=1 Tax=Caenorhabditis angaria TaxID=860376 RepID=A0A9P1IPE4_9PELO|nr:unnamed protein product [Caenorhabditis angaria]
MFSGASNRSDNQEEKKPLLSQTNSGAMSSKTAPSSRTAPSSQTEPSNNSTYKPPKKTRAPGPKMSDGTEFDTGPWGWVFSILYLFFLWGLCIAFACGMVYLQYTRMDQKLPNYFGTGSFLGNIPRANFDPNPKHFVETPKNLMEFNIYDISTYMNSLIRLKKVLQQYISDEKPGAQRKELCSKKGLTKEEACKFDRYTGFNDCKFDLKSLEHGFGFSKGQPCIMLKLNKLIGWEPKFLNRTTCAENDLCCGEGIQFECTSDDDLEFAYYPENGIPACYFPYYNQPGYEQPFVMVKISNITESKLVEIECMPTNKELREISGDKQNQIKFFLKMKKDSAE